eukprot:gene14236-46005_t
MGMVRLWVLAWVTAVPLTAPWEQWWKAPGDVELVQFLGKDN